MASAFLFSMPTKIPKAGLSQDEVEEQAEDEEQAKANRAMRRKERILRPRSKPSPNVHVQPMNPKVKPL